MIFAENGTPGGLRLAVFASGRGSNLQAILDAISSGFLKKTKVVVVISNNSTSGALEKAHDRNIPAVLISRKQFGSDEEMASDILTRLEQFDVNLIALAGYMKKIHPHIVRRYRNRIINIHPALLPAFGGERMYGMHVHEAVIASGARESGASVHIVDEEYDRGPVILQRSISVAPDDTPESLSDKVLAVEHVLYPEVLRLFEDGCIHVAGRNVSISAS